MKTLSSNKSFLLIKVRIAIEVKRSDAGDVSPVAMFFAGIASGTFLLAFLQLVLFFAAGIKVFPWVESL